LTSPVRNNQRAVLSNVQHHQIFKLGLSVQIWYHFEGKYSMCVNYTFVNHLKTYDTPLHIQFSFLVWNVKMLKLFSRVC